MDLATLPLRSVYLDHAATTPTDERVVAAMLPFFTDNFGNPSALYAAGRRAAQAVAAARQQCATLIGARSEEIIFTSGGTESDNLAVWGVARQYHKQGAHILTSNIEHHAVYEPLEQLKKEGFTVKEVPVDGQGVLQLEELKKSLCPGTTLVSIMLANNEIGTWQPIAAVAKIIAAWKKEQGLGPNDPPFLHTDACQAAGAMHLDVHRLGVDLLTLNGSKIYGPKGVGLLFVRQGIRLQPLIVGGGQEGRRRSGTENVASIVGLATALELVQANAAAESARLVALRERLWQGIKERIPKVILNGHPTDRLPNNLNVTVLDIEGEAALLYLDEHGIAVSTGSACTSASLDPSHVILALGRPYEHAHGSLRFTLGHSTTAADIDYVLDVLVEVVKILRRVSPMNLSYEHS